ncbi:MAG TPA: class I SAM-dependent methyltransferase, partial [Candidatus Dormibacteraeota bacterium]|nr:class I SAM-dependent methyltransferase [Candidatus Dormibacteraeota bacterium]
MSFVDVMGAVLRWTTGIEAAAALGAELSLMQSGQSAPPEIAARLRAVSAAAGLDGLEELTPQQRAIMVGIVRLHLHHAEDLLDSPARAAGWTYTDPVILDGWGRGSTVVPSIIAAAIPELGEVRSFLDVGTGVGLLAVSAAALWPEASIVGLDTWEPSLARARANIAGAGLQERIALREQNVADIEDVDAFDVSWVPTFFISPTALTEAVRRLVRATRPGGWIVLGRFLNPPDPVASAVGSLRTIRGGGSELSAD